MKNKKKQIPTPIDTERAKIISAAKRIMNLAMQNKFHYSKRMGKSTYYNVPINVVAIGDNNACIGLYDEKNTLVGVILIFQEIEAPYTPYHASVCYKWESVKWQRLRLQVIANKFWTMLEN